MRPGARVCSTVSRKESPWGCIIAHSHVSKVIESTVHSSLETRPHCSPSVQVILTPHSLRYIYIDANFIILLPQREMFTLEKLTRILQFLIRENKKHLPHINSLQKMWMLHCSPNHFLLWMPADHSSFPHLPLPRPRTLPSAWAGTWNGADH